MNGLLLGTLLQGIVGAILLLMAVFLILLVLVQRGRGGGLSGALGGMGGQSAFGTRAGDTFTRITIVTAAIWIATCALAVKFLGSQRDLFSEAGGGARAVGEVEPTVTSETGGDTAAGTAATGETGDAATGEDFGTGGSPPANRDTPGDGNP